MRDNKTLNFATGAKAGGNTELCNRGEARGKGPGVPVTVPRENRSRMNDWIRKRIIFRLFYSIYKKDTNFLRNLMRAIHEIAREIIILNSIDYKTNYLLLWRYPIKRIPVTGQQNGSAD